MEAFSVLLTLGAGNAPVTGEFPSQRPVTRSFGVFFDLRLNKRLSKQSRHAWFETPLRSLWRHCNVIDTSPRGFDQSRNITNVSRRPGSHNRYSYIMSPLRYWCQDKRVNTMAADALAPGIARPSGALVSTTWDKLLRTFTHDTCLNVLCLTISIFCSLCNCARCYGFIFVLKIRAPNGEVFSQNCMAHLSTWISGCLDDIPLMIPGNRTLSVYYQRTKCRSLWVGPSVSSWWP